MDTSELRCTSSTTEPFWSSSPCWCCPSPRSADRRGVPQQPVTATGEQERDGHLGVALHQLHHRTLLVQQPVLVLPQPEIGRPPGCSTTARNRDWRTGTGWTPRSCAAPAPPPNPSGPAARAGAAPARDRPTAGVFHNSP